MSRNKEERISPVKVKVIDFTELEEQATEELKKRRPDQKVICAKIHHNWAFVETAKGLLVLNDEGVGDEEPVSETNPMELDVHGEYVSEKEGWDKTMDVFPVFGYRFTDPDEIRNMPHVERPLSDFIRRFGRRLESNFQIWEKHLMETGVEI